MRVVCALILEEGRVLACRRPFNKDEAGKWEFPGGKVESGELDEEALAREILEELEMRVSVGRRLCSAEHDGLELIGYVCERVREEWKLREHLEARWVDHEQGDVLDWAVLDVPLWEVVRARVSA
jgi:8-oxo-dGTP diphosphatase